MTRACAKRVGCKKKHCIVRGKLDKLWIGWKRGRKRRVRLQAFFPRNFNIPLARDMFEQPKAWRTSIEQPVALQECKGRSDWLDPSVVSDEESEMFSRLRWRTKLAMFLSRYSDNNNNNNEDLTWIQTTPYTKYTSASCSAPDNGYDDISMHWQALSLPPTSSCGRIAYTTPFYTGWRNPNESEHRSSIHHRFEAAW